MFIKFGDKTKKIVVKNSRDDDSDITDDDLDDAMYMDDESEDRRLRALKKYDLSKKLHKTSK